MLRHCQHHDSVSLYGLQTELRHQLAEYTAADWEGYRVMQLKVQALVKHLLL